MNRKNVEDLYPLSPLQQGMLFHTLYSPGTGAYLEQYGMNLRGSVDVDAFRAAWQRVVDRHGVLRTGFVWEGVPQPLQAVFRQVELPFTFEDWSGVNATEREHRYQRELERERRAGLDLVKAPLMHVRLYRFGPAEWRFGLTTHHLLLDGWSLPIVMGEFGAIYAGLLQGEAPSLPARPPFREYITWLNKQDAGAAEAFWRARLAGITAPTPLPLDRAPQRAGAHAERHATAELALDAASTEAIEAAARRLRVTANGLFQCAWARVLAGYTGETDVVFGATVSGRPPELQGVDETVGMFINAVPVRIAVPPAASVAEWVQAAHAAQAETRAYEHAPLASVRAWSGLPGDAPLFETLLVYENYPLDTLQSGAGEALDPAPGDTHDGFRIAGGHSDERTNYPLSIVVAPSPAGFRVTATYDPTRLEPASAGALLAALERVLDGIVEDASRPAASLSLLSGEEAGRILRGFNPAETEYPRHASIPALFAETVAAHADAPAIVTDGTRWSYAELDARANRLARWLRGEGVGMETRVGVALERSPELIVALLGILKAGGAYVPLDPAYPAERRMRMARDAGVTLVLADEESAHGWADGIRAIDLAAARGAIDAHPADALESPVDADALAYVIFTSGSTGVPKGVAVPHRAVVRLVRGQTYAELGPETVLLQLAPVAFDASTFEIWGALLNGGAVAVHPPFIPHPDELGAFAGRHGVTTLWLTAGLFHQVVDAGAPGLGGVRELLAGGDVLPAAHLLRAMDALPETRFVNGYGPTESTTFACCHAIRREDAEAGAIPIGPPIAHTTAYVLDGGMRPVPAGAPGELYLGGDGVARGYIGRAALTAERFVPDPFAPGARLYRTGDRARWNARGELEFLGRADRQVKVRGYRIEPGEIEAALLSHPAVRDAIVDVRDDGAAGKRLVAYAVVKDGANTETAGLREQVAAALPEHMVPSAFVLLPELPLTPNGKVDRARLPDPADAAPATGFVPPEGPAEEALAEIWREVLKAPDVGAHDSFFLLGGHSLLAMQVASRVRAALAVDVPLRVIFDHPTLREMAARIEEMMLAEIEAAEEPASTAVPSGTAPDAPAGEPVPDPGIVPVRRTGDLPASLAQERLWFIDRMEPGNAGYNVVTALRLRGALDVDALRRSLGEIVRRHEALRTVFAEVEGRPVQRVQPFAGFTLAVEDVSKEGAEEAEREMARRFRDEAGRGFDLAAGPLVRARLLRLGRGDHALLVVLHHIASDGWSMGVMYRELSTLYHAFSRGLPSPLKELPVQYGDFAAWQRSPTAAASIERQIAWWRDELADAPHVLDLPTDRPRTIARTFNGGQHGFALPTEMVRGVRELAQSEGATPFMVLLAAWQLLLARYAGANEVLVGSAMAGRARAETEPLIGFFANTLVLRGRIRPGESFREYLAGVRNEVLNAFNHTDVPFERLVDELQVERSLSRTPLYQATFALTGATTGSAPVELDGLTVQGLGIGVATAKTDVSLGIAEGDEAMTGMLEYSTDLFEPATAARMANHFGALLAAALADPARPLRDLPLMDAAEAERVRRDGIGETVEVPTASFHRLFEAQATRTPDAPALRFHGQTVTYAELNARANRLSHRIATHLAAATPDPVSRHETADAPATGVREGGHRVVVAANSFAPSSPGETRPAAGPVASAPRDRGIGSAEPIVAVSLERGPEQVVALLAANKAGAAFLPVDPRYPAERRRWMLEDSAAGVIVTTAALAGELPETGAVVLAIDTDAPSIALEDAADLPIEADPDAAAYVIFTSGSTGRPKGVIVPHRGIGNLAAAQKRAFAIGADARVLQFASLSFDAGVAEVAHALLNGACLVLADADRLIPGPGLVSLLRDEGVTHVTLPPPVLAAMPGAELPALRTVVSAGEAVDASVARRWSAGRRFVNAYGPTETTVCATVSAAAMQDEARPPIGRPIPNVSVHLLDDAMRLVPLGVPGELHVGGVGVARGYLGRPALTAERFVPDPFATAPGARLYRTGDRARLRADGELDFLGRTDAQVKLRGFRIEPGEVRAVLREHPSVRDAAVILREDAPGAGRLVAYVTPAEGGAADVAALREHAAAILPEHMVPSAIVALDALPLTPSGKVDRAALPLPETHGGAERPLTPTEDVLATIWAELLGPGETRPDDNFFELGGHSLLAAQVIGRIRTVLGVDLPVRTLFEAPRLDELAARVDAGRRAGTGADDPIVPVARHGDLPVSFAQERMWFLQQLDPASSLYNMPSPLRIRGRLDVDALRRSFAEIVRRHEPLRTVFAQADGQPVQRILPAVPVDLPVADLSHLAEEEREAGAHRRAAEEAATPFDLERGPLFRVSLLRLGEEDHVVLWNVHHAVSDGWSYNILRRELVALYDAFVRGRPSPLPELPVQYADYVAWQRRWLTDERMRKQVAYWKEHLAGAPPALELPTDRPRPPVQRHRGAWERIHLPAELHESVHGVAAKEGATMAMTLLAAFALVLGRLAGQDDVVIGSPIAGRARPETEPMIGLFLNTLAIRTRLPADETFAGLLRRVREAMLGAYAHQDVPFERLLEELSPERTLSRAPVFQVMFNMLNLEGAYTGATPPEDATLLRAEDLGGSLEYGAKFDLTLYAQELSDGIHVNALYDADLFDGPRVSALLRQIGEVLRQASADAGVKLRDITLLPREDAAHLPDPAAPLPAHWFGAVHEMFTARAAERPGAIALIDAEEEWSYARVEAASNRIARLLRERGVLTGDVVAVHAHRSAWLPLALLGIAKAGAAWLILDPAHPDARLAERVEIARPRALLRVDAAGPLSTDLRRSVEALSPALTHALTSDTAHPDTAVLAAVDAAPVDVAIAPDDLAYLAFTSGTTGAPKAIAGTHRPLSHFFRWYAGALAAAPADRFTMLGGLGHDPLLRDVFAPLTSGGTLHIPDPARIGEPGWLAAWFAGEGITATHLTPAMGRILASSTDVRLPALRFAAFGGDVLRTRDVAALRALAPSAEVVNVYGATETPQVMALHPVPRETGGDPGDAAASTSIPVGHGIDGVQLLVLNAAGTLAGVGERGEVAIRTPYLARGYANDPELTAARFRPNPATGDPTDRVYLTGDLGRYRPDGAVEIAGRADRQVQIRGFRVEPAEAEAAISAHPAVRQAAVVPVAGADGEPRLVAYVVTHARTAEVSAELRGWLKGRLPDFATPSAFVRLDALPLTANGKLDLRALPDPEPVASVGHVAPRTAAEQVLAELWAEVLRLERVGVEDNFFALGGHSLLATQVLSRVDQAFGVKLPVRSLFEHPTVASLAAAIEATGTGVLAEPLDGLDALSDDELAALLAEVEAAEGD